MIKKDKSNRNSHWLYRLLTVTAVGLIGVGMYLLLMPKWIRYNQDKITKQLLDQLDKLDSVSDSPGSDEETDASQDDNYIWVDPDAWVNSDEEVDYFIPDPIDPGKFIQVTPTPGQDSAGESGESDQEGNPANSAGGGGENIASPTPGSGGNPTEAGGQGSAPVTPGNTTTLNPTNNQGQVGLQAIGKLVINKINVNIPIVTGLSRVNLRYAASHFEATPMIGDNGLSAIFAHRSPQHGRDLNRLNEIVAGDRFEIVRNNKIYHYLVEKNIIVEPNQVLEEIFRDYSDDSYVMLVTCHPIPTWKQRMLVIARLVEVSD